MEEVGEAGVRFKNIQNPEFSKNQFRDVFPAFDESSPESIPPSHLTFTSIFLDLLLNFIFYLLIFKIDLKIWISTFVFGFSSQKRPQIQNKKWDRLRVYIGNWKWVASALHASLQ